MSQGTKIKVHITGGPPWGFRLQGGGNTPVSIAKIRRKSKAYNARLQEGDELVAVNGRNVRNLTRDVTMSYVDGANESLDLEVLRRDKNFNTVNASSTYSITNNNAPIPTGKAATIQLVPSGTFQAPGRPASTGSVRQTTNVQSRSIPGERSQTQQTITRTVTQRVGDGDEKTSTTTEVKKFGSGSPHETTTTVINTGGQQPRTKAVAFQPATIVGNAKPTGWSPSPQAPQQRPPQQRQPEPIRAGQKATIHLQGSYDEPPQQETRDLAQLIPSQNTKLPSVQFSMRPSLAKPQSVSPTWHPHAAVSSAPSPPQDTGNKRWSSPVKTNVGKEMTITFGGPSQPMNIPVGVAAPMMTVVAPSKPEPQQTTVTKYSTRTVTTMQQTSTADDEVSSDEEPPQERVRTTTTIKRNKTISEPVSILDDPSIILRGGFKPKDPKKVKMMRPKSFPGASSSVDEPDLPETDKMKACKTIADLLMFPKNKSAKGAKMFAKRRKRSAKWTLEAYGTRGEDEELPDQIGPKIPAKPSTAKAEKITRLPGVPPPAPPPPPPLPPTTEPVYIPQLGIHVTPTDFSIDTKKKDKCEHKTVTPQQCGMLVADLKGASGRGASMFERRRKRSEKFVLTNEAKFKNPDVSPDKENEPPAGVTLEFIAMHGGDEEKEAVLPTPPVNMQRKTPWEAAMQSPIGSIDSAFNHMPKKRVTGGDSPPKAERPKPPAEWMATTNILPQIPAKPPVEPKIKPKFRASGPSTPEENGHSPSAPIFKPRFDARKQAAENAVKKNYKDFNIKARGWGNSPQHSPENTPPTASPASVHSADYGGGSPGFAASLPTQPLKYGGGYNDFNSKPRSFGNGGGGSPRSPSQPWASSPPAQGVIESDEL